MPLEVVKLSDGSTAYKLNAVQAQALSEMIANQIWWDGFRKRVRRVGVIVVSIVSFIALASSQWPWLTDLFRRIFGESGPPQ